MAETQEKRTAEPTTGTAANNNVGNSDKANTDTAGINSIDPKELFNQAKDTAGQAYEKVSEQATSKITVQKENLAHGLTSVADGIRQMGENLRGGEQKTPIADLTAKYGDSLANQVEQISNYIEKKDLRELLKDVEVFARRNPAVFVGGAFALGVAAARFLKSSSPNQSLTRRPRREREGIYIPDKSEGVYLPEDLGKKVGLTDSPKTSAPDNAATGGKTSTDAFSPKKGG